MLTKKQYELLMLIDRKLKHDGVPPSFDEMKDELGLASKSGIHRLITALEERGYLRRLPHKARALEVLKLPENVGHGTDAANVVRGDFGPKHAEGQSPAQVPLYGRIAAGTPIEALRDESDFIDVPPDLLGRGDSYALEVDGDSMIEAGIHDGDMVLIERCDTAENGAIVVALVDNEEVTLKRLRRKGQSIALEPANKNHEIRILPPDRVKVQGKLIGLMRRY